ncbi:Teichuronic acid biosynthesis protein TuaB [Phycisphaerales bacterium]|nr:Teichuronic acid biosynthesis protein TuaB [Phycisphaerales bacterium]
MTDAPRVPPQPTPSPVPALGRSVMHGSFWMLINTVATRFLSLANSIVLGRLLGNNAWGTYAIAIAASSVAAAFRDGGMRQLLLQRQREYETLVGPVFWIALLCNSACALLLALTAPLIASYSQNPETATLVWVIATSLPISTPGIILQAKLSIDMRFKAISNIQTVSGTIRFGGAILLAVLGFGAVSFVLPLLGCAVAEWAMGWWLCRDHLWNRAPRTNLWLTLFKSSWWLMAGALGTSLLYLGGNLVMKAFVPLGVVGAYFFAYSIIGQVWIIVSANLNAVFLSAMAKIAGEPARLAAAAPRALRQTMLLAGPMAAGLAVTFPALETLFWDGHKADSVNAVLVQGIFYPVTILIIVPLSVQQSRGRFRSWAIGLLGTSICGLIAAAIGAHLHGTPEGVAGWSSGVGALVALAYSIVVLRRIGVSARTTLAAGLPGWLVSTACGLLAWWIDSRLAGQHIAPALVPAAWQPQAAAVIRFLVVGCVYSAAFALAVRFLLPSHLRETLAALPVRLRALIERMLRIRSAKA